MEEDEELQEDSFIAGIEPDIFDFVTDSGLKVKKTISQWHVLSLDLEDSASQTQGESQDPSSSDSQDDQLK